MADVGSKTSWTGILIGIAGTIAGSIITLLIKSWWDRAQPKKILVKQLVSSSLITLPENIQGLVKLSFRNTEVTSVFLTAWTIKNLTKEKLNNIVILIKLIDKPNTIVSGVSRDASIQNPLDNEEILINIPHLKSYALYKHEIDIVVASDRQLVNYSITGDSEDWVIQPIRIDDLQKSISDWQDRIAILGIIIVIVTFLSPSYLPDPIQAFLSITAISFGAFIIWKSRNLAEKVTTLLFER